MTDVTYRNATAADLPGAAEVYLTARNAMLARMGFPVPADTVQAALPGFQHVLETGLFAVAEADGRIVGKASAVVRDGLWFLSGFWVLPEFQRQKVGGPLLRMVWEQGAQQGAKTYFVWASSDLTAMASYMKRGMVPGAQLLTFRGDPERLALPGAPGGYEAHPLDPAEAAAIDAVIRATRREVDHRYWSALPGRLVVRGGKPCGYYYVNGSDIFGGWLSPEDGEAVLTLGCRDAVERTGKVMLRLPGVNHLAIQFALGHGFLLQQFSHLLMTAPFGKLDQYVTSGPLLF